MNQIKPSKNKKANSAPCRAVLVLLAILFAASAALPSFSEKEDIVYHLTKEIVNNNIPAMAVYVVKNGVTEFSRLSGVISETESNEAHHLFTENHNIEFGRISRLITSITLIDILEKHRISADSPILEYLPASLKNDGRYSGLSFRQVLDHSSAIPNTVLGTVSKQPQTQQKFSKIDFLKKSHIAVIKNPSDHMYSSVNSVLAAVLAEQITGKKFAGSRDDFLKTINVNIDQSSEITPRFLVSGGRRTKAPAYYSALESSETFIASSKNIEELLKFLTSREITKDRDLYYSVASSLAGARSAAFEIKRYNNRLSYISESRLAGSFAKIMIIPDLNLGVYVYYNSNAQNIAGDIIKIVLDKYFPYKKTSPYEYTKSPGAKSFEGSFYPINQSSKNFEKAARFTGKINISYINDGLLIAGEHYMPISPSCFYSEKLGEFAEFTADKNRRLKHLILGNQPYRRSSPFASTPITVLAIVVYLVLSLLTLALLYRRWEDLLLNRVDERPRLTLLFTSSVGALNVFLSFFAIKNSSTLQLSYGLNLFQILIKYTGWLSLISFVMLLIVAIKVRKDYKWRGWMNFVIRISVLASLFFSYWICEYNFICLPW